MKKSYKWVSLLALSVSFINQTQISYATQIKRALEESNELQSSKKIRNSDMGEILKRIKENKYISSFFLKEVKNITLEDLKDFEATMTVEHDLFDDFVFLLLNKFSDFCSSHFDKTLKDAQEKGEKEEASAAAQTNLGMMYNTGIGVEENEGKAVDYFKKAAHRDYAKAQYALGKICTNESKDKKALDWFKKAAHQGYVKAGYNIGSIYEADFKEKAAFKWYEKAAHQGHASAQERVGNYLKYGRYVNIDYKKAFEWSEKAAHQGQAQAQDTLASLYQQGFGIKEDLMKALEYYLKAAKNKKYYENAKNELRDEIKSFVEFIPSSTSLEAEEVSINLEIIKNNLETILGWHDLKRGINRSDSKFKEDVVAIPSLFSLYGKIVNLESTSLQVITNYNNPGFMITCLRPKDQNAFKLGRSENIKYYEIEGQNFLTFGRKNIEIADKLIEIFNMSLTAYTLEIFEIQKERKKQYQSQTEFSSNFLLENQKIDLTKDISKVAKACEVAQDPAAPAKLAPTSPMNLDVRRIDDELESFEEILKIPQQLKDLLLKGINYRNKLFLKNNPEIEDIFN